MAEHFIKKFSEINDKNITGITSEALDKIIKYSFPGNVRELENMIEHAIVLCRDENIGIRDLPMQIEATFEKMILDPINLDHEYEEKMKVFESEMIKEALSRTNGNQSAAARILNITERHLRSRLERLGLKKNCTDFVVYQTVIEKIIEFYTIINEKIECQQVTKCKNNKGFGA